MMTPPSPPPHPQVTWTELYEFIEWARLSVHPIHITPGANQSFYVDMAEQVQISLRVCARARVCVEG
jgi:hypothetical protein